MFFINRLYDLNIPLMLVAAHFIADWLFQSDWMALNKSKHWDVLAAHVSVYTLVMSIVVWLPFLRRMNDIPVIFNFVLMFGLITWVTHFITDAITSRITTRLWFIDVIPRKSFSEHEQHLLEHELYPLLARIVVGKRHWFFVVIGFDQLIHYITLAITWQYLVHY
jgi:hypothetical protein